MLSSSSNETLSCECLPGWPLLTPMLSTRVREELAVCIDLCRRGPSVSADAAYFTEKLDYMHRLVVLGHAALTPQRRIWNYCILSLLALLIFVALSAWSLPNVVASVGVRLRRNQEGREQPPSNSNGHTAINTPPRHGEPRVRLRNPTTLFFQAAGASFAVPIGLGGQALYPWRDEAEPPSLDEVLAWSLHEQRHEVSGHAFPAAVSPATLAGLVRSPDVRVTGKPAVIGRLSAAVLAAIRTLAASPGVNLHGTHQYGGATLAIARVIEYAAAAELDARRAAGCSAEAADCRWHVSARGAPPTPTEPDWVIIPVDLGRIYSPSAYDAVYGFTLRLLADLGVGPSRVVLFFGSGGRDMQTERAFWRREVLDSGSFAPHSLAHSVFISPEGHPPWGWDAAPVDMSIDMPYMPALHAEADRNDTETAWPLGQSPFRPLRVTLVSGARKHNWLRSRVREDVDACVADATLPAGSCATLELPSSLSARNESILTLALYASSVFCVMPTGDTPLRRGVYEAVLMGCIPVTLRPSLTQAGAATRPHMWGFEPWKYALHDVLPLYEVLDPDAFIEDDVRESPAWLRRLLALPPEAVSRMQEGIRQVWRGSSF